MKALFLSISFMVLKILAVIVPLMLAVAYYTYVERRVIGFIQVRLGPNRVGPYGLLQPIADGLKLVLKENFLPSRSNAILYILAPILTLAPAVAAWAVVPFSQRWILSDISVGLLYLFAMTSLSVYGMIIAGWGSNSKYAFLGTLRAVAQTLSYELPMGFAFIGVVMLANSLSLKTIVLSQSGGVWHWYCWPLLPLCVIYWICAVAKTNRAPFDVAEGESEIVAGFHVEYSGMLFALFFLAEYATMLLVSVLAVILFFGGWLSPFEGIPYVGRLFDFCPGIVWLLLKASFFACMLLWYRATFPRFRYDQIMRLGWKVFLPITLVWIVLVGLGIYYEVV